MKLADFIPNELLGAFAAGFLGAAVALSHMHGLTLRQHVVAFVAGGLTASFIGWAMQDLWRLSPGITGGLTFVFGLVAFKATPALMKGVSVAAGRLPSDLAAAIVERIRTIGAPK